MHFNSQYIFPTYLGIVITVTQCSHRLDSYYCRVTNNRSPDLKLPFSATSGQSTY